MAVVGRSVYTFSDLGEPKALVITFRRCWLHVAASAESYGCLNDVAINLPPLSPQPPSSGVS